MILSLLIRLPCVLAAHPLISEIKEIARQRFISKNENLGLNVDVLTPIDQLANLCPHPEWSFPGEMPRIAGQHMLTATCGKKRFFIRIKLSVSGTYWIARHRLRSGQVIADQDIEARQGILDKFPTDLILSAENIINKVARNTIQPGQFLRESLLKVPRLISAGQEVSVMIAGEGFYVSISATALNHAGLGETLRVRTQNGKLLTGTVSGPGKVNISHKK